MNNPSNVRVKDLNLSPRAVEGITAGLPGVRNPTVRDVIEGVTASRLRELPGIGEGTVGEIEGAIREACGVSLIAGRKPKAAVAEAEPVVEAPAKKSRKKAR